jgi:hypothetical protein
LLEIKGLSINTYFKGNNITVTTAIILFGSYFIGIIIHEIGELLQILLKKLLGGHHKYSWRKVQTF